MFLQEDGSHDGFCFACGHVDKNPYGGDAPVAAKVHTPKDFTEQINAIMEFPVLAAPSRSLGQSTLDYFGIRCSMSEYQAGEVTAWFFPYKKGTELSAYKVRTASKDMYAVGTTRGVDPFGWEQAQRNGDTYRLFITEGEFDAAALYKALKMNWKSDREPSVISLVNGSRSVAKTLGPKIQDLRKYREIVLVYDQDQPGQDAVQETVKLLGDMNLRVAHLPLKDANDMVIAGRTDELFRAVMYDAVKKVSGKSFRASELYGAARRPPESGLSWPWDTLTDKTRGRRRKEVYYFGAGVVQMAPFNREVV